MKNKQRNSWNATSSDVALVVVLSLVIGAASFFGAYFAVLGGMTPLEVCGWDGWPNPFMQFFFGGIAWVFAVAAGLDVLPGVVKLLTPEAE